MDVQVGRVHPSTRGRPHMEAPPYFLIEDSVRKPGRARKPSHGKFESLEGPERHHVKHILGNPGLEGHAGII